MNFRQLNVSVREHVLTGFNQVVTYKGVILFYVSDPLSGLYIIFGGNTADM